MSDSIPIDVAGSLPVVQPSSVAELSEVVRRAAAQGQAIYPRGGGTMAERGLPPTQPGLVVDMRRLDQVIDYPARDMTITVQAGVTLAKLQALLATENQRLPIDVPQPEQATLGGALAVNVSGPRRYGFGTLRDYVIGISVVNGEGHEVKAGGRVVKNVAGYDMCKLYIGSLGTLGIISQVTLKLRPRPEEQALASFPCADSELPVLLDRLHGSRTRPICIDVLNAAAVRELNVGTSADASWRLVVGFEDNREAVRWQLQQLARELALTPHVCQGDAADSLWHELIHLHMPSRSSFIFKANLLPHSVADVLRCTATLPGELALQAHAGNGIVIGHATREVSMNDAALLLSTLQQAVGEEGNVIVLACPVDWKQHLPIWGRPRGDAWLMRQVKDKLDPRRLFNPGCFVDGI